MDITQAAQGNAIADTSLIDILQDKTSAASADAAKLEDVARKFEGILIHEMFKQVQQSIEMLSEDESEDGDGPDTCGQQYQSLYWSQMADAVSNEGGMGFWKNIYGQIQHEVDGSPKAGGLLGEKI